MAKPKFSDELKVQLALDRFEPMKKGQKPLGYDELRKRHFPPRVGESQEPESKSPKPTDKTIQRAILDAFRLRLVEIARPKNFNIIFRRTRSLELALERAHPLKKAIVVEIDPAESLDSDSVHAVLGRALAQEISNASDMIRPGDLISVGSGRGPHNCISALNEFPKLERKKITIMSLTGCLFSQGTADTNEFLLDADTATGMLAAHFIGEREVHPTVLPIAVADKETRDAILSKTRLAKSAFDASPPTHAIIGVGVLSERHRFYQEIKRNIRSANLESVRDVLTALVNIVDLIRDAMPGETYVPIADVCNRLFYCPPPRSLSIPLLKSLEQRLRMLIETTNDRLLTVTKTQLRSVGTVMVVAGTPIKARAIYWLLTNPPTKIDVLCTDSLTAREILKYGKNA